MFFLAIICLVTAIVAALIGFGVWSGPAAVLARVIFGVGLILFLVLLVRGRLPPRR